MLFLWIHKWCRWRGGGMLHRQQSVLYTILFRLRSLIEHPIPKKKNWPDPIPHIFPTITVYGVTTSDDNIIPPFSHGLNPNMEAYIKCLKDVMLFWVKTVTAGRSSTWQQDSAPCYRKTHSWLSNNFCDHIIPDIWPPISPDYKPIDYCKECSQLRNHQNSS